jgi:predicted RNA-binding protein YlqC (UPF0109 family)
MMENDSNDGNVGDGQTGRDPLEIQDLLQEICLCLVDYPDDVKVEVSGGDTNTVILKVTVAPSDVGKILGKEGKTINAIREVLNKVAAVEGKRCILEVFDPKKIPSDRRKRV